MGGLNRGEVRWADFGGKRRPVVVLTRQSVVNRLTSIVVAPCTTRFRDIPTEVAIGPDEGMPQDCVINLDSVSIVKADAVGELVTTLDVIRMRQICVALNLALGCDHF